MHFIHFLYLCFHVLPFPPPCEDQNNNSSNYCYYYYYNDSNEARSQRLHGKLWCHFINVVDRGLLKMQRFVINVEVYSVAMKDGVTFYLRTYRKKRLTSSHCNRHSSRHSNNSSFFSQYIVRLVNEIQYTHPVFGRLIIHDTLTSFSK